MIPQFRSTLTRLDLSSVLTYMVDNSLYGNTSSEHLVKECVQRMDCDAGMSFRSPVEALKVAKELISRLGKKEEEASLNVKHPAKKSAVCLPVLAPAALSFGLERNDASSIYYDVDESCIEPTDAEVKKIHELKNTYNSILFVRYLHFGMFSERKLLENAYAKDAQRTLFTLDVGYLPINAYGYDPEKHVQEDDMQESSHIRADMYIVLCEQNTLFTGGGGAVLCVRGKTLSKALREYKHYITTRISQWTCLSDMNASLAIAQLKQLNTFIDRTKNISKTLTHSLEHSRHTVLLRATHPQSLLQTLPIQIASRKKEIMTFAIKQGVECITAFSHSILHMLQADTEAESPLYMQNNYPCASRLENRIICFPLYPSLDNDEVNTLSRVLGALP